ncbi:hypothetical protein [Curtobacterium flaccumfaciens]|uniref:hypothetical protein n=1 Tax=Curtobacterium flaccumfaciens TaxID=2035 RepID=UPI000FFE5A4B|nr:hypothetical protein [Curtobacterium flaccumfaciens]MCS0644345.1 hypothetical protein [Curtobacterium flaccumfaciens pv. flaccumfaciens]MCS6527071.1 hypothetical protein [Curtobacterium flaccumfaciens pv. flaccumfaciens]MCS6528789.1 hypothetical protein [Curtobacterium flaccumfaciens pv. flaccumfaciens]NUU09019.1 hypothetical protein [Curtobacterium flaccumfaciens]RXF83547.1 hypothetical protein CffCFBP3418_15285 [Curtobacterium flaccumfaciens pv. flaccumfaciens]
MTKQQITAIAGLLLLAMLLTVLIGVFDARRRVIAAEGNDLRSGQSAWVTATIDELMRARSAFEPGTKVFVGLDGDVRAVVVLSGKWTDVPLHDGHALTGRPGEALVGAAVDVRDEDITVGGKTYNVVGRLGVRGDSLLSDDVVLADPSRFSASPQRLLLDGPHSVRHYSAEFPGRSIEIIDDGTNRRTNVDAVSPVLVALGALVIMLIAVVAGLQAGRWELRAAAVRFTTGIRSLNTLRSAAARVAVIGAAACATALAGAAVVRQTTIVDLDVTPTVVAVGTVVLAVSVASFWQGSRRWNC